MSLRSDLPRRDGAVHWGLSRIREAVPGSWLVPVGLAALALTLAACGGGASSSPPSAQVKIREARNAGEKSAHEEDQIDSLERQMRSLRRQVRHKHAVAAASADGVPAHGVGQPAPESSDVEIREFHVASGNVSCQVSADGATCTVEPISQTFSFADGGMATSESGSALPLDLGELVPYGTTVAVGSVSCEVPPSNVPQGIVCVDADSGHGFEASRVASRQKAY